MKHIFFIALVGCFLGLASSAETTATPTVNPTSPPNSAPPAAAPIPNPALKAAKNALVECVAKMKTSIAATRRYRDGTGSEGAANQASQEVTSCFEGFDPAGRQEQKNEIVNAWKITKNFRDSKIIPAIKAGNKAEAIKLGNENSSNLDKLDAAIKAFLESK